MENIKTFEGFFSSKKDDDSMITVPGINFYAIEKSSGYFEVFKRNSWVDKRLVATIKKLENDIVYTFIMKYKGGSMKIGSVEEGLKYLDRHY